MNKTRQVAVAAAVAALCAANAFAAEEKIVFAALGDVHGKVLINKGQGFVTARPGMEVRPGDRVIALDDASARILYKDGCVTDLKENNLLALDGKGCDSKPVNSRSTGNIKLAQAIGGTVTDVPSGVVGGGGGGGGLFGMGAGMTGLVIGGTIALGGAASTNNDNKNASGE